jgi:hypothetical protein
MSAHFYFSIVEIAGNHVISENLISALQYLVGFLKTLQRYRTAAPYNDFFVQDCTLPMKCPSDI